MQPSKIKVVCIEESHQQAYLSPAQKKFNRLIQKIDAQKKLLVAWQETIPQCHQKIARMTPLNDTFCEHQAEMVAMLDTLYTNEKFTHHQQDKIAHLITSMCEKLISQHGREDLKPIYDYYSEQNYDDVIQEDNEMASKLIKSMFEKEFGVELDDSEFDFSDREGTTARLTEKMQEQQRQAQESRSRRKKSAKQLAQETLEQEEEANISKSIQAVYRQLVAALHPDRELDPTEHQRKTELMQKVTVAYGNRDLLQLLELQLSVEQIDQHKINNIAEDRLKHYNTILQNQLEELQQEVKLMEQDIRQMVGLAPYEHLSPKRVSALLNEDIHRLRNQISRIQHDLRLFNDVKQFQSWLKGYRVPEPEFDPFF